MSQAATWRQTLRARWIGLVFLLAAIGVGALLVGSEPVTSELRVELGAGAGIESVRVDLVRAGSPESVVYFEHRLVGGRAAAPIRHSLTAEAGTYTAVVSVRAAAGERRFERRVVLEGQPVITLDLSEDMK